MKSFLIVKDNNSDTFSVLGIDSCWYEDGKSNVSKQHELAEIDAVTSLFPNKEELVKRLSHSGYINSKDVDLFVVVKDRNGALKIDDVLYGGKNPCFANRLAYSEVHGHRDYDGCQALFSQCAELIGSMDEFRDLIFKGSTRLSPEIVDSFSKSFNNEGSFDFQDFIKHISYRSIRNVMIAFGKKDRYSESIEDIDFNKYDTTEQKMQSRERVLAEFKLKYFGDFCPGQISFFPTNEVESVPLTEDEEKKYNFYRYGVLLDYLESIKKNIFIGSKDDLKFNINMFKYPISKEDRKILEDLPCSKIRKNIFKINSEVCKYEARSSFADGPYERFQMVQEKENVVRRSRNELVSLFNNNREEFYKTENWVSTLARCIKTDSLYDSIGYSDPRYGESIKVFGKRPNETSR